MRKFHLEHYKGLLFVLVLDPLWPDEVVDGNKNNVDDVDWGEDDNPRQVEQKSEDKSPFAIMEIKMVGWLQLNSVKKKNTPKSVLGEDPKQVPETNKGGWGKRETKLR